jgi:integrase
LKAKKPVEPMRKMKDIENIKKILKDGKSIRNYCVFICGINWALRASDLLAIKLGDVRDLQTRQTKAITEKKTGKTNYITMNTATRDALDLYLTQRKNNLEDNEPLFLSQKSESLTVRSLNRLVQQWTDSINLKGHFGSHSLRKTWGYVQRKEFGTPIELIQERYKHSSPAITRLYLGIEREEVEEINLKAIG